MRFNFLNRFSFFVISGIALGTLTGGFPIFTNEIAGASLFIALTLSLSRVELSLHAFVKDWKNILISTFLNFGLLSFITLALSAFFSGWLKDGFVVIASMPPAVAVLPLTILLKGDVKKAFLSISWLYMISLLLTPLFTLAFLQRRIDIILLIKFIFLFMLLPFLISRILARSNSRKERLNIVINLCFFLLAFSIVGKGRDFILFNPDLFLLIFAAMVIRTFFSGSVVKYVGTRISKWRNIVHLSLLSSFKNEGLAMLMCISLFPSEVAFISAIPAIVATMAELLWASILEWGFKKEI